MNGTTRALLWVVGIGAFTAGAVFGFPLLAKDAFADHRPGSGPWEDQTIGMQLNGVKMSVFDGDKLMTEADIGTVNIGKDRQTFGFLDITGRAGDTDKIDFTADKGDYNSIAAQLRFQTGIRLQNKDFDLFAPKLTVDDRFDNIQIPGPLKGTLAGGKFVASNVKYKLGEKEMITGPVRWQGTLPKSAQQGTPITNQRIPWDIQGNDGIAKNGIMKYTDARATDGEQLIRAKNVDFNSKTDVLIATGPAYYYGDDINLVADKITVYRKERRLLLEGNVRMLVKPKDQPDIGGEIPPMRPDVPTNIAQGRPDPPTPEEASQQKDLDEALRSSKTIRDYPALIKAATITYWYRQGERRADIQGSPECLQDFPGNRWRRVVAGKAFYDGEKETLKLETIPGQTLARLKTSIGDDLTADWFEVSTKEGEEDVQDWTAKNPKGKVMVDDDEVPTKGGTGSTTGGAGTGGTGGGGSR